ncbi:hypothetical protein AcdelDRAFT_0065 [Acidovorax delafieldii 2AN]|uniref:SCP2 domain-containing protein n=1 Tax=Acidovorax delafieldii 2AN TaxID=573060 RepID=C5SZI5_ACIDE|nr:hypothetical protein [Acidovorax delafieldii]EER62381.1 hypothetical protein AcdelDRAFT_0065 [Acidovorax delafieldii 2AN]
MHTIDGDPSGSAEGWLAHRGRWVNVTFLLKKGEEEYLITLRDGRVTSLKRGPHVMPRWTFALVAGEDTWQRFWAQQPQPRFHDLMAMVKFKTLRVEGDPTIFMSNLLYFKELVKRLGGQLHAR